MHKHIAISVFLLLLAIRAFGGWHIVVATEEQGRYDEKHIYIQGNMIKSTYEKGVDLMMNLETDQITVVDHNLKAYWTGKPQQMERELLEYAEFMIQKIVDKVPEDQREKVQKTLRDEIKSQDSLKADSAHLKWNATSETDTIADFSCTKYEVYLDSILVEEAWISSDFSPFLNDGHSTIVLPKLSLSTTVEYNQTTSYKQLLQSGFPLRKIVYSHNNNYIYKEEVLHIVKQDLTANDFTPGEAYVSHSLAEILLEQTLRKEE